MRSTEIPSSKSARDRPRKKSNHPVGFVWTARDHQAQGEKEKKECMKKTNHCMNVLALMNTLS
jgi:hypothetical protein